MARWAILIDVDEDLRGANPLVQTDGWTPMTFATREDAMVAAQDPALRPHFASEHWYIAQVRPARHMTEGPWYEPVAGSFG